MIDIKDFPQGSDEWFACKLGVPSASRYKDIIAKGTSRNTYMLKLAAETLTGTRRKTWQSEDMRRGTEQEPEARKTYEFIKGVKVQQVGFGIAKAGYGASPDGLVGRDGGVEIKSVLPETQIVTVISGKMPPVHEAQVQGNMLVFNRKWWDFVSYSPLLARHIFVIRIKRDKKYIAKLEEKLIRFKKDLDKMIEGMR